MSDTFDKAAIPKSYERLRKAQRSIYLCRKARTFGDFASHWADFLVHAGGVLNMIQAGTSKTPQGRQWHGKIKRFGKTDQLVSYLHQARNAVEHSVDDALQMGGPSLSIGYKQDIYGVDLLIDENFIRDPHAGVAGKFDTSGKPLIVAKTPAGPQMKKVRDERFKNEFEPPMEHDGKPLLDRSPLAAAEHYIAYLRALIQEARGLP